MKRLSKPFVFMMGFSCAIVLWCLMTTMIALWEGFK